MIRLGEAVARVECSEKVLPLHVKEAARLLKGSIIHVEHADVPVEMQEEGDEQEQQEQQEQGNGRQVEVSWEMYQQVTKQLLYHLSQQDGGIREATLVQWFLDTQEQAGEIDSELKLQQHCRMCKAIIHNMLEKEKNLVDTTEPPGSWDST